MSLRLINYICLYDTPAFLTSSISTGAAFRDLKFMQEMRKYRIVDQEVAERVLKSLTGQTWYLDQPWIITAWLGDAMPEKIARTLADTPRPSVFSPYCVTPSPSSPATRTTFGPQTAPSPSVLLGWAEDLASH